MNGGVQLNISIVNYRNLNELGIDIDEGKINFLYGVCGSGKSSILDAMSHPIESRDISIGHESADTTVKIDGEDPTFVDIAEYSLRERKALFEEDANNSCYRVFVGDESKLANLEAAFDDSIASLRMRLDDLYAFRAKVDDLAKAFGKLGKSGTFTPKSKFGKARSAASEAMPSTRKYVKKRSLAFLNWMSQGFDVSGSFEEGRCPFCGQVIPDNTKTELLELKKIPLNDLKPLFSTTSIMSDLNINEPDYGDDSQVEAFVDEIKKLYAARESVNQIIEYCTLAHNESSLIEVPRGINVDPVVFEYIDGLEDLVKDINTRVTTLTGIIGSMSAEFKRITRSNSTELNRQLEAFGIPYEFTVNHADRNNRTASYVLKHVGCDSEEDMREVLSYGEKNLVSLLLFLHSDDASLTLIDDPASSYDDFRRTQIYGCIMKEVGETALVVSHDQAFVRRAVRDSHNERLGKVLYMQPGAHKPEIVIIDESSFVSLDDEVVSHICSSSSYYQRMINLRLYCDIHRGSLDDVVWKYASAIIHRTPRSEIQTLLGDEGKTEQEVLALVGEMIDCKLNPMPETLPPVSVESLTDFELLIAARELLRSDKKKGVLSREQAQELDMLNDMVHMNDCALFCLNPYRYGTWPRPLSKVVERIRKIRTI
jgi:ABC-type uncharacterized transport system ATPase subunit